MPTNAATSAWLIYDTSTTSTTSITEAPWQAAAILQYCLLAEALVGLANSIVMAVLRNRGAK